MIRSSILIMALALLAMSFALSACQNRPGDNAYGRYSNPTATTLEPYNEDWYKDYGE